MKITDNIYSIIKLTFVFMAILISVKSIPAQTETATFDTIPILKAKLNQDTFRSGEDIKLFLTLKNKTNLTVGLFDVQPERSFNSTVKDANGSNVFATAEGQKKMKPDIIMARESISIEPGKTFNFREVRLNELFDLTQASNYTLEVKRNYYFENAFTPEMITDVEWNILMAEVKFSVE